MAKRPPRITAAARARAARAQVAAAKRQLRSAEKRLRQLERDQKKQRKVNARYKAKGLSYAKRLVRGLRSGKTRQQARGHRPREHVTRAANAAAEGKLTSAQKQKIARFAKTQAVRADESDYRNLRDAMTDFAEQDGFASIEKIMQDQRRLRKEYVRGKSHQIYANEDVFKGSFDITDIHWMYYH